MCFRFERTSDDFSESEREIHIQNLRLMLVWASWKYESRFRQYLTDPKSAFPGMNLQHIPSWISFCLRNRQTDPSQIFSLLCKNQDVLSIQIAMCNLLAVRTRMYFCVRSPDMPGRHFFGTCSRKVQVGDQIVRFEGVPQLLIVRPHHEAGKSIEIISPVADLDMPP
jgi:hypothetical protein